MPLRLLQGIALQTIVCKLFVIHGGYCKLVQAIVAMASYCAASYCKPSRLLQAIVSQPIANLGGYGKLSHCKLSQDNRSQCELVHCKLLQAIAAIARYRIASHCGHCRPLCCKPLRVLQAILIASYCLGHCVSCGLSLLSQSIALPAIADFCKLLHCKAMRLLQGIALPAIANYCKRG